MAIWHDLCMLGRSIDMATILTAARVRIWHDGHPTCGQLTMDMAAILLNLPFSGSPIVPAPLHSRYFRCSVVQCSAVYFTVQCLKVLCLTETVSLRCIIDACVLLPVMYAAYALAFHYSKIQTQIQIQMQTQIQIEIQTQIQIEIQTCRLRIVETNIVQRLE